MPIAGMLVGVAIASFDRLLSARMGAMAARGAALAVFVGLAALCVSHESHFLFRIGQTELIRQLYETNPFLESPAIADYVRAHTKPDDKIAVIGSEPQILFYAQRQSATGYMYMLPADGIAAVRIADAGRDAARSRSGEAAVFHLRRSLRVVGHERAVGPEHHQVGR